MSPTAVFFLLLFAIPLDTTFSDEKTSEHAKPEENSDRKGKFLLFNRFPLSSTYTSGPPPSSFLFLDNSAFDRTKLFRFPFFGWIRNFKDTLQNNYKGKSKFVSVSIEYKKFSIQKRH